MPGTPFSDFFRESVKDPQIRVLYGQLVEEEFSRFFAAVAPPSAADTPLGFSSPVEDLVTAIEGSPGQFVLALKAETGDEVARWVKGEGGGLRDFLLGTGLLVADEIGGSGLGEPLDVLTLLRRVQDSGLALSLSSLDETGKPVAYFFLAPDEPIGRDCPRSERPSLEM